MVSGAATAAEIARGAVQRLDGARDTRLSLTELPVACAMADAGRRKDLKVTKVEPWNSVRITFNIPRDAALRLKQLAERGDDTLRELGILSLQVEGDQVRCASVARL